MVRVKPGTLARRFGYADISILPWQQQDNELSTYSSHLRVVQFCVPGTTPEDFSNQGDPVLIQMPHRRILNETVP